MIQRLSHTVVYVLDQNVAYDFYVNKLGFTVRRDQMMPGGFRWLTVSPAGQGDLEIVLMAAMPGSQMSTEMAGMLSRLVEQGVLLPGVFETHDCQATYRELTARGVEFTQPPAERFYGIEAMFKDPFGNRFSLTQPKRG